MQEAASPHRGPHSRPLLNRMQEADSPHRGPHSRPLLNRTQETDSPHRGPHSRPLLNRMQEADSPHRGPHSRPLLNRVREVDTPHRGPHSPSLMTRINEGNATNRDIISARLLAHHIGITRRPNQTNRRSTTKPPKKRPTEQNHTQNDLNNKNSSNVFLPNQRIDAETCHTTQQLSRQTPPHMHHSHQRWTTRDPPSNKKNDKETKRKEGEIF